jgi:hypothetical protein
LVGAAQEAEVPQAHGPRRRADVSAQRVGGASARAHEPLHVVGLVERHRVKALAKAKARVREPRKSRRRRRRKRRRRNAARKRR